MTFSPVIVLMFVVHGHDLDAGDLLDHRFQELDGPFRPDGFVLASASLVPFRREADLTKCCSAAVKTPGRRTTRKSPSKWAWMSFGPRPM